MELPELPPVLVLRDTMSTSSAWETMGTLKGRRLSRWKVAGSSDLLTFGNIIIMPAAAPLVLVLRDTTTLAKGTQPLRRPCEEAQQCGVVMQGLIFVKHRLCGVVLLELSICLQNSIFNPVK